MKHAWKRIIVVGMIAASLTACARREKIGPLRAGRALEKQGEYVAALSHYEQMKDEQFRDTCIQNLRYLYGDILDAMQAMNAQTPSAEEYFALGQAYYDKAESLPDKQAFLPNMSLDLRQYADAQRASFQERALASLHSATAMQPNHADALLLEGIVYEEQGESDKAIVIYQKLLQNGVEQAQIYDRLAALLYERGEKEDALDLAKQAAAQFSTDAQAHFTLGNLFAYEGKDEDAIHSYRRALCADPSVIEAYYRIAQYYLAQNDLIDAERVMKLGVFNNAASVPLNQFYAALKTALDEQLLDEVNQIFMDFSGDAGSKRLGEMDISEQTPGLQLQYHRLRLKLVERLRPYRLPCEATAENPYFDQQVQRSQREIDKINALLNAPAEDESAAEPTPK